MNPEILGKLREAVKALFPNTVASAYMEFNRADREYLSVLSIADDVARGAQRLTSDWDENPLEILVIDRELFESDVMNSDLLEAAAGRLLLPFLPFIGEEDLARWERLYKRRKIMECLKALAMEHPDLSSELLIDPRYFVHCNLLRLSHIIPQAYELLNTLDEEGDMYLDGYREAITDLRNEGVIQSDNGLITVETGFIDKSLKKGNSISNQLTRVQRQLQGLFKLGIRGAFDLFRPPSGLSLVEDLLSTAFKARELPSHDSFLHFPTATTSAPLSESTDIDELLTRLEPSGSATEASLQRFGGVLNEVYLLTYKVDETGRKAIVKRYPNWVSLKWAPIALWTLGTQNFAVLGRSRMERECAATSYLSRSKVSVPRILYTSFMDRLLLREYVEGENLVGIVKTLIQQGGHHEEEGEIIRSIGGTVAAVHHAGYTLGDCKPENFIVQEDGKPFIVDLEQGARGGDETWDLAEFLYFSGQYASLFDPPDRAAEYARSFLKGYIDNGGKREVIAEAARLKYTKIFTPITPLRVIQAIVRICSSEEGWA